jgi:hypothetical protein
MEVKKRVEWRREKDKKQGETVQTARKETHRR